MRPFAEVVTIPPSDPDDAGPRATDDAGIELLVGRHVRIRLARGFDAVTLRRAVESLSAPGDRTDLAAGR